MVAYPKSWAKVAKTALPQGYTSDLGTLSILRKAEDDHSLIVAGYASPQVVDREHHLITREALAEDLPRFLAHPHYRNVNLQHTNITVGEVLPSYTDDSGKVWTSHVDDVGLFVVAEVRTDPARPQICEQVERDIISGKLRSFSISGDAPFESRQYHCENGSCFWCINKLILYEVTICEVPVNQDAHFTILSKAEAYAASSFCQDGSCSLVNTAVMEQPKDTRVLLKAIEKKAGGAMGSGASEAAVGPESVHALNTPTNQGRLAGRTTKDPRGGNTTPGPRAGGNAMSAKVTMADIEKAPKVVKCRKCGEKKMAGDICPTCASGMPMRAWGGRRGTQMSVTTAHGFHEPTPNTAKATEPFDVTHGLHGMHKHITSCEPGQECSWGLPGDTRYKHTHFIEHEHKPTAHDNTFGAEAKPASLDDMFADAPKPPKTARGKAEQQGWNVIKAITGPATDGFQGDLQFEVGSPHKTEIVEPDEQRHPRLKKADDHWFAGAGQAISQNFVNKIHQDLLSGKSMGKAGYPEQFAEAVHKRGFTHPEHTRRALYGAQKIMDSKPANANAALNAGLKDFADYHTKNPVQGGSTPPGWGTFPTFKKGLSDQRIEVDIRGPGKLKLRGTNASMSKAMRVTERQPSYANLIRNTKSACGSTVGVYKASGAGLELGRSGKPGRPNDTILVCEDHGSRFGTTRLNASRDAKRSDTWCPHCKALTGLNKHSGPAGVGVGGWAGGSQMVHDDPELSPQIEAKNNLPTKTETRRGEGALEGFVEGQHEPGIGKAMSRDPKEQEAHENLEKDLETLQHQMGKYKNHDKAEEAAEVKKAGADENHLSTLQDVADLFDSDSDDDSYAAQRKYTTAINRLRAGHPTAKRHLQEAHRMLQNNYGFIESDPRMKAIWPRYEEAYKHFTGQAPTPPSTEDAPYGQSPSAKKHWLEEQANRVNKAVNMELEDIADYAKQDDNESTAELNKDIEPSSIGPESPEAETPGHDDDDSHEETLNESFPWSDVRTALHDILAAGVQLSFADQMAARHVYALLETTPVHKAIGWVPFEKGNWVAWGDAGDFGFIDAAQHVPIIPLMENLSKAVAGTEFYNETLLAKAGVSNVKRGNKFGLWTEVADRIEKLWGISEDIDLAVTPMIEFMGKTEYPSDISKSYSSGWLSSAHKSMATALRNITKLDTNREAMSPNALIALDTLKDDLESLKASIGYERDLEKELVVNDLPEIDIVQQITKDRPDAADTFRDVEEADRLKAAAMASSERGIDQEAHPELNAVRLAKGEHEGSSMLAWMVPSDIAKEMALPDGEAPEHMHVTLAVFDNAMLHPEHLIKTIQPILEQAQELTGKFGGLGRFTGDDKDVFYANADVPGLSELRAKIIEALKGEGIEPMEDHGYSPHCTLKYLGIDDPNPSERMEPKEIKINQLSLVSDDNKLADFALGAGGLDKAQVPGAVILDTSLQGSHSPEQYSRPLRSEDDQLKDILAGQKVDKFESQASGLDKPTHVVGGGTGYGDEQEDTQNISESAQASSDQRGAAPPLAQIHRAALGVSDADARTYASLYTSMWKRSMGDDSLKLAAYRIGEDGSVELIGTG